MQPKVSEPKPAEPHSKAFETLVQEPDDVVGYLAYALYKEGIRERVRAGQDVPRYLRNPTKPDTEARKPIEAARSVF